MSQGEAVQWPAERVARLGSVPDIQLAEEWGLKQNSVAVARIRRGISAFQGQKRWTAQHVAMLGKMSDAEVAKRTGRSKWAVTAARRERGIHGVPVAYPPKP